MIIQENCKDLHDTVKALEKGDAQKASHPVQDHVCRFNRRMEEN